SSYFFLHDPPPTEPHPLSLHDALPISGLVQALGLARIAVVAHDIGATVAQPLARHSPDLVSRLVLFDLPYPGIGRRWREPGHARDRKSTRLNSSHVESSYAVFCLKKKK